VFVESSLLFASINSVVVVVVVVIHIFVNILETSSIIVLLALWLNWRIFVV